MHKSIIKPNSVLSLLTYQLYEQEIKHSVTRCSHLILIHINMKISTYQQTIHPCNDVRALHFSRVEMREIPNFKILRQWGAVRNIGKKVHGKNGHGKKVHGKKVHGKLVH